MTGFQYYTPLPEQFILGFKFEFYLDKKWIELEYTGQFTRKEVLQLVCDGSEGVRAKRIIENN